MLEREELQTILENQEGMPQSVRLECIPLTFAIRKINLALIVDVFQKR